MVHGIYNIFLTLLLTLGLPLLPLLVLFGRRAWEGFPQRMGLYPRGVKETLRGSRPIWVHAVSVGEVLSVSRLILQIRERFPDTKILLSTSTRSGHRMASRAGIAVDAIVFFPIDHPWIVGRALGLFDPSLLIFLETEIWPNFLHSAYRRGIPTVLLSGRISPRAFHRYFIFRSFFSLVVRRFNCIGMQNAENAERMIRLGVDPAKVKITGSLKHAPWEEGAYGPGGARAGLDPSGKEDRQVLVAGSTHRGEEELLLGVFLLLKSNFPGLLMILAPRHPHRFAEVERLLQKRSVNYEKRSLMDGRKSRWPDVVFMDTLGDLPATYALADVAFVGGSLIDAGGHNLMEPARWHKPILFGPHMTNFAEIAEEMKARGGGIEVRGEEDLIHEISALLSDREKARRMGELAWAVVAGDRGVLERSIGLIRPYVERPGENGAPDATPHTRPRV